MADRLLVTSALPYANGPIHLGHLAGAYLPADLYCRYQRLAGREVLYVCGSDEHGVPIMLQARKEGVSPQEVVDRYHAQIRDAFERFGMSFDFYGRTTSAEHRSTSQEFFRVLHDAGTFRVRSEQQLFDPEAGLFLADRFVRGTCPSCGYEDAYGDQCERCGTSLSPKELINPRSALTGAEPVLRETTHWFLPLGEMQPGLEAYVARHPEWKAHVLGQVRSWFAAGLTDRAMTRDLPWGIPVPLPDVEGKVLYVWFDAPIGYVSISKEWAREVAGDPEAWRRFWQDPGTDLVHFIGKDNIVFHCLIFPALLMAHNAATAEHAPEWVLPANVPANEFMNLEGQKLSTSRGWAVWLHEALEAFEPDVLRYALATMLPEQKDADFSWREFQARVNAELADVLGNFVNRTLTFAHRFADGRVPELVAPSDLDRGALRQLGELPHRIAVAYEGFRLREAVQETMALARLGNKYFNDTEPWHTRTSDPRAMRNTLHVCLQLCAALAVLMDPVLPHAASRLRSMLRLEGVRPSAPGGEPGTVGWQAAATPLLTEGHALGEPSILFRKIEDEEVERQLALLAERARQSADSAGTGPGEEPEAAPYEPPKETIQYDDFARLDLRLGEVVAAEPHPNADKLLRLEVDLGFERRQVLAGIAGQWEPADLVGRKVVVVANLAPRRIRGLESQGMVLMAEDREGRLVPVGAESEPGAVVR